MWTCSKCKKQIEDDCEFCYNCGESNAGYSEISPEKKQVTKSKPTTYAENRTEKTPDVWNELNSNVRIIKNILLFFLVSSIVSAIIFGVAISR